MQLIRDHEDISAVNSELEKMGYNIGQRLIDEYLAKVGERYVVYSIYLSTFSTLSTLLTLSIVSILSYLACLCILSIYLILSMRQGQKMLYLCVVTTTVAAEKIC